MTNAAISAGASSITSFDGDRLLIGVTGGALTHLLCEVSRHEKKHGRRWCLCCTLKPGGEGSKPLSHRLASFAPHRNTFHLSSVPACKHICLRRGQRWDNRFSLQFLSFPSNLDAMCRKTGCCRLTQVVKEFKALSYVLLIP